MRFLRRVKVVDFRSLAAVELPDVQSLTPIVGVNGSGKSNLLRALSALFTDNVEGADPLTLSRDYRRLKGKKKQVTVEVELDFAVFGALRTFLDEALAELGALDNRLTVRRTWSLDANTRQQVSKFEVGPDSDHLEAAPDPQLLQRVLAVVRFRYIPNHVHPTQLVESETDGIRRLLQGRIAGTASSDLSEVFERLREGARKVMGPIDSGLRQSTGAQIQRVELATPANFADLAWAFGLRLLSQGHSDALDVALHGSGVQSVLAYRLLKEVDMNAHRFVGWRKGALWVLEEPESFLHAALQAELARYFSDITEKESIQLLFTTHSPAFVGAADTGVISEMNSEGRSTVRAAAKQEVIAFCYGAGVTPFVHPLHAGPPKPLLLSEGKDDATLIRRAFAASHVACPFEISCLEELDPSCSGGSQIPSYLRYQRAALQARPAESPVIVLLDWETKDSDVAKHQKELACHPTSRCVKWPESLSNQDLSPSFAGIERFLSTAAATELADDVGLGLTAPLKPTAGSWRYDCAKRDLEEKKLAIHRRLADRDRSSDLQPLIDALPWLVSQLTSAPMLA